MDVHIAMWPPSQLGDMHFTVQSTHTVYVEAHHLPRSPRKQQHTGRINVNTACHGGSASAARTMRSVSAPSNSSWHVFSRIWRNVTGLSPPAGGGNSGSSLDSFMHRSAYIAQYVGCSTAFSNTSVMVWRSTSAVVMTSSSCCSRRSNFSGVSLFRMPLMVRRACRTEFGGRLGV